MSIKDSHVLEQIEKLSAEHAESDIWNFIHRALNGLPTQGEWDYISKMLEEKYETVEGYNSLETIKFTVARNEDDCSVNLEFLTGQDVPCRIKLELFDSYYNPRDEDTVNDFDCGVEYYDVELQDWFENDQWEPAELDSKTITLETWDENDKQTFLNEINALFKQWDMLEKWTLTENQKKEIASMMETEFVSDIIQGGEPINEYPVDGSIDGTVHSNIGDAQVYTFKRSKFEVITWRENNDIGSQGQQTYKRLGREAYLDSIMQDKLEEEAGEHNLFITGGEGDPCDIMAGETREIEEDYEDEDSLWKEGSMSFKFIGDDGIELQSENNETPPSFLYRVMKTMPFSTEAIYRHIIEKHQNDGEANVLPTQEQTPPSDRNEGQE